MALFVCFLTQSSRCFIGGQNHLGGFWFHTDLCRCKSSVKWGTAQNTYKKYNKLPILQSKKIRLNILYNVYSLIQTVL